MFDGLLDFNAFGWRDVVGLVVAGLAIYMLIALMRVLRLGRETPGEAHTPSFEEIRQAKLQPYLVESAAAAYQSVDTRANRNTAFVPDEEPLAWREAPQRFAESQVQAALEREVEALRDEVDTLRESFSALREDLLKDLAALRSQQGVAAFYKEAMQLALTGNNASQIAEQCGMARAEAELVVALAQARSRDRKVSGDFHGG